MEWFWILTPSVVSLLAIGAVIYFIVDKIVEEKIRQIVINELQHMERKQDDRFQVMDQQLQELKTMLREQHSLLNKKET